MIQSGSGDAGNLFAVIAQVGSDLVEETMSSNDSNKAITPADVQQSLALAQTAIQIVSQSTDDS